MKDETDEALAALEALRSIIRNGGKFTSYPSKELPDFILGSERCMVAGSQNVLCKRCGATLWLYDGLEVLQRYPTVPVVCMNCAAMIANENKKSQGNA